MIRINLLAGSAAPPPPRGSVDVVQRVTLACSVILVAMVVVIGWRFWSLRQESNQVQQELTAADQEIARLGPVVDQVERLDAERDRLEQHVGLIQGLRSGQSGPVHVLDELSRAMPEGLWLAQLEQDADDIVVEGRTFTLGALSDFMANLEGSEFFDPRSRSLTVSSRRRSRAKWCGSSSVPSLWAPAPKQRRGKDRND